MSVNSYTVTGMTCSHCVAAVKSEVGQVNGVNSVDVDLQTGTVTVISREPVDDTQIREAVEEAGYELAR
jgi:copper chaperone